MKHFLLVLAFIGSALVTQAQTKLSKDPAQFVSDVKTMLAATRNEGAIKVGSRLEEVWSTNQMTSSQQAKLIDISQKMLAKKLKARPHYENFFGALVSGITIHKLSNSSLNQFLDVAGKAVETESVPALEKFLQTSYSFLDSKIIYKSATNSLRVVGGTFQFAYRDGSEPEPVPEPVKVEPKTKAAPKKKPAGDGGIVWNDEVKSEPAPAVAAADFDLGLAPTTNVPPVAGPVILLQNIDLFFVANQDSLLLKGTEGAVLLTRNIFVGNKGRFEWTQPNGQASAVFNKKFSFDTSKPAFKAEGVTLTYADVLEAPVEGVFEYRNLKKKTPTSDTGYPKFTSNTNNARLKTLGPDIKYIGGFSMAGTKTSTQPLDNSPSNITVSHDSKPKFKATAANYNISDSVITADRGRIIIYQGTDSLTHPGLQLKYNRPQKKLILIRADKAQESPFYNSYHAMEVNADMLTWDLQSPQVHFGIISAKSAVAARLTSKEYFTEDRFEHLKGTADFHPLIVIANYADKRRQNSFYLADLTQGTKFKEGELREAAIMLAKQNFLDFNGTTGQITMKPKGLHYLKSAQGKKDYDNITLKSISPSGKNAMLDLNKNELLVRGIDRFYFTGDSSAVYALPDSNQVRIMKNRDIQFNGVVIASLFRFRGSKFTFKYDEFLIDMKKIDTVAFAVKKTKKQGIKGNNSGEQYLSNSINRAAGTLYLNKPDNKSGKKKYQNYPMFDATSGAYVFFNKPQVLGGAYDTTVYFAIPPFKMDSLNSNVPGAVGFKGKFYSGGIFPPIETKLVLMEDQSLGFEYTAPKGGLPAYGGKGKFYNNLKMSYKGLQGAGEITYLTSKLKSNAFTFYQDKVLTMGTQATVKEATVGNAYYMQADFNKYALEWFPLKDTMNISTVSEPIKLYQNQFTFKGVATITPKGFYGDGTISGVDGGIIAPILQFSKYTIKANNATLEIKSKVPNKPAIRASDVFLEYDLKAGLATFSPERTGFASTDFPYAQFRTSLNGGRWDVKKKTVTMNEPVGQEVSKAYFISTRKSHDNLKFNAKSASYDISKNTLEIGGVPYIASADAHIVPENNHVFVTESSDLKAFQNATLISDTLQKYHRLYKGEIDIVSRLKYQGYANTKYTNAVGDTFGVKFGKFTMRNMDKVKPVVPATLASLKPGEINLDSNGDTVKYDGINTEILPDDDTTTAVVTYIPKKKKGLLSKVGLSGGKKKGKATEQAPPAEETATSDSDIPAEGVLAETKKSKKFGLSKKKDDPVLLASADTSAIAFAPDKSGKRNRKSKKDADALASIAETLPHTAALATIKETDKFLLTPGVQYKGEIIMNSNQEFWTFNGQTKLAFSGAEGASDWFPYKAIVNPAEVKIDIEEPKAADATPLKTGLHISAANNKIYNTFVSKKKDETDLDVFEVEGQLTYLKKKKEYRLGKETRASGQDYAGNLLVYSDSLNVSRYEGKFNLIKSSKNFALDASGIGIVKPSTNLYTLDALLAFDIDVPEAALITMGNSVSGNTSGAPESLTETKRSAMPYKIAEFVGNKDAASYAGKSTYTPLPSLSSKLAKSLVFNTVDLRWSDSTKAWYSKGKLGLANILKKDINAQVPGYIEIKRGPDTEIVNVYLEPLPSVWYLFTYDNNLVTVTSSDEQFNAQIAKKRSSSLVTGEPMDKAAFVNAFRKNYLKNVKMDAVSPAAPKEAPQKSGNFDFMEEPDSKKKKKKTAKEETTATPEKGGKTKDNVTLPGMEDNKKKKTKKGKDDGLLPDVDMK